MARNVRNAASARARIDSGSLASLALNSRVRTFLVGRLMTHQWFRKTRPVILDRPVAKFS